MRGNPLWDKAPSVLRLRRPLRLTVEDMVLLSEMIKCFVEPRRTGWEALMIRKILGSAFGLALVLGGVWWGYEQLFLYAVIRASMLTGAAFMILLGGYVLWALLLARPKTE